MNLTVHYIAKKRKGSALRRSSAKLSSTNSGPLAKLMGPHKSKVLSVCRNKMRGCALGQSLAKLSSTNSGLFAKLKGLHNSNALSVCRNKQISSRAQPTNTRNTKSGSLMEKQQKPCHAALFQVQFQQKVVQNTVPASGVLFVYSVVRGCS